MRLLSGAEAPLLARVWYRNDGSASPLTRSLANAPDMLETLMPFLGQIMGESSIDLATKELVIVLVSQLNGCRYCLAAHRPIALDAGVPVTDVVAEPGCPPELFDRAALAGANVWRASAGSLGRFVETVTPQRVAAIARMDDRPADAAAAAAGPL